MMSAQEVAHNEIEKAKQEEIVHVTTTLKRSVRLKLVVTQPSSQESVAK